MFFVKLPLLVEQRYEFVVWDWSAIQIALKDPAAHFEKCVTLFLSFDVFSDHIEVEIFSEVDYRRNYSLASFVVKLFYQLAVDLYIVEAALLQNRD